VLHVDDEPDQLLFARSLLEDADLGLSVESCSSPFEALERVAGYDCVLTDYQMPEMDGIEFTRKVKRVVDVPIILYTGRGSEEVASAAFAAGANDYLKKEIDPGHYQVLARRVRHVVEWQRTERALRESEERYRTVINASKDAIYVVQDGKYAYINQQGVEMLGYETPSDLLGRDVLDFFHPDERPRIAGYIRGRHSGEDTPTEYVAKILRRDGSTRAFEIKIAIIRFGGVLSTLAIGRDVTEREKTAEALRESEAEKTTLLSTIPDGLSLVDREYRYLWANELEASRVGKKPGDLIGKPCFSIFNDRNEPCVHCLVPKVFQTGKPENWTSTESHGKIWRIMANPIMDAGSEVASVIVLSRDITEIQRSQNRTNALHASTLKIESTQTEAEVWGVVFEALTGVLGYKQTGIGIVEDGYLKFKATYRVVNCDNFLPLDSKGVTLRAIRTLKTQMVRDTREDPDYVEATPEQPENVFLSELAVPIILDGVGVAVLNAESNQVDGFTDDDRKLLEILALYTAQALKRIQQVTQLRESEDKYRRLAENAADVLFLVSIDGTIVYTSKDVNPHLGYAREEIIGKSVFSFLSPFDAETLKRMMTPSNLVGVPWTPIVLEIAKKGGGTAILEFNPSPIISEGRLTAIQVVVRDVSGRIALQRKLNALHVSAHRLSEAEELAQVWEIGVDTLRSVLGFRRADIGVIVGDVVKFSHGLNKDHPELVLPLNGRGITVRAIKMMHTQLVQDVSKDESYVSGIDVPMKYASELVVPIISDERVAAVINLEDDKINAFTEEDINLAETLALHIASAVGRLWRVDRSQRESARLAALHKSSIRLSTASSVDEVWHLVFEDLRNVMGFEMAGVGLVVNGAVCFTRGTSHIPADTFEIPLNKPSISGRAVKTKETQYVRNIRDDPDYVEGPQREGVKPYNAEIAVPVMVGGEVVAVLNVEVTQPEMLGDGDVRLMEALALHASTAISRLRQREDERRYRQRLEILNRHASDLEGVETLKDALRLTYDSLVALGLMSPSISLLQGDILFVPPIDGRHSVSPMSLPISGPGITVRAVKTKKTQLINDAASDPDLVPSPEGLHIGSELVVPMKISDEIIGVLNLESTEPNAYTEEAARIVEMLASHVSSTLARLRILEGLHRKVEERTSALLSAEQMAAAGRVSAMVAHDLRGPLQTISNASRVVRKKPEKTEEMLGYIDSAVERSIRMLEDLRLNTREEPLRLIDTDLRELVSQAIKELPSVEGIEFDVEVSDSLKAVSIDPLKIRRVLDNLLRNAVEAMPGGGKITVNAKTVDGDVVIEISDTGKGIPPVMLDRLFRPFATTKMGGLGLGLTYCKKAVEDHGGTITGRNAQGSGAVFSIRLPLKRVE